MLLLGGSVLEYSAEALEQQLEEQHPGPVRVFNLAREAHSTLDSYYKYRELDRRLGDRRFDLVVFYHGINELRANNTPPDDFRDDYSHYTWYASIAAVEAHPRRALFTLPFTVHYLGTLVEHRLGLTAEIPTSGPPPELTRHGSAIKTAEPFRRNLDQILELSDRRGEPVLLMSFAWFVPDGYSIQRFGARQLDYSAEELGLPIEIWGRPEHVVAGIEAHNVILREAAQARPGMLFVDQEALMPRDGEHFGDICHFTELGTRQFVENLLHVLAEAATP